MSLNMVGIETNSRLKEMFLFRCYFRDFSGKGTEDQASAALKQP